MKNIFLKLFVYITILFSFSGCFWDTTYITVTEYQKVPFATFPVSVYPEQGDFNVSSWPESQDGLHYRVMTAEQYNAYKLKTLTLKKRYNSLREQLFDFNQKYKTYLETEHNKTIKTHSESWFD